MPPMPVEPVWLRANVSQKPIGVDRAAGVIRGYVVAQEGPFKTPGRGEFDGKALKSIVKMMNESPAGLKSRFAHPTESDDGLGKFLGRSKGAWLEGEPGQQLVRANLHFDRTALDTPPNGGKPLGIYLMDLAESDSEALSSSLVLNKEDEVRLEKNGTRKLDENGQPLPPLWRPTRLHASDIVDTGDAVDGLLSVERFTAGLVAKGTELLDNAFAGQTREVVEARCQAWLGRYLALRFGEAGASTDVLRRRLRLREGSGS